MEQTMRARILVGSISGVPVDLRVRSDIVVGVVDETLVADPVAPPFVAFLGGFSERILERSLDEVEERATAGPDDAKTGGPGRE